MAIRLRKQINNTNVFVKEGPKTQKGVSPQVRSSKTHMAFRRAPVLGVSGGREGTYKQCIQCSYRERGENALYYIKVYSHPLSRVTPCLPSFANPSMVMFRRPRGSEMFMHFSQLSTLSNAKLTKDSQLIKIK